ncbi:60S acidic ribosomal protein P2 isoform X1 [Salmo salar]|uniref:Large ribosomal subunit protein P2 n=5 Tax=Salmoninae TaxID=504568 RepID=B9ELQ4_SALSA|nr:60S acidic ribosomal protein P2 isoform X1 [Salmo salar]ACM08451.1 60S acidic ribosomal protein P2 [Salmo salar]
MDQKSQRIEVVVPVAEVCGCARRPQKLQDVLSGDGMRMRYVSAYLLAVLGGNTSPSSKDIKTILGSVGIEAEDERLDKVVNELNGKDINEVMNSGLSKLASVPAGGAVAAPAAAGSAAAGVSPTAAEEKKEEKEESEEGSDDDMGFGLFD